MSAAKIILASTSPYRKNLLSRLRLPFSCVRPHFDESALKGTSLSPKKLALQLAYGKAASLRDRFPEAVLVGSDQVIHFKGKLFGKPGTPERARRQLRQLSGKQHELICSVVVLYKKKVFSHTEVIKLTLHSLTDDQIRRYVSKDKPLDCAGSYKVESLGISLMKKIEGGDPTAIEGLPLVKLSYILRKLQVKVP